MISGVLLLMGSLASLPSGSIMFRSDVRIEDRVVRLGDVADLALVPQRLRVRADRMPLFAMSEGQKTLHVSRSQLASRARSLMPALRFWLADMPAGDVLIRRGAVNGNDLFIVPEPAGKISKGDPVTFHVRAGIFDIARQGTAIQDAAAGQHMFVRTEDNKIVSACLCGDVK